MSWNQAVAFCERFTRQQERAESIPEGYVYRLPTEAEWEYALFDMHGNVSEWSLDFLLRYPDGTLTNPVGRISGDVHVLRGGSWHSPKHSCRSAFRHPCISTNGILTAGFRVALAPRIAQSGLSDP